MVNIVFFNSSFRSIQQSGLLFKLLLFVVSILFVSGCATTPKQQTLDSQYTYSIIIKARSAHLAQKFINGLKEINGAQDVEIIELTDNYSEFRAWSQHDSSAMYSVIVSVLDNQGQRSKVSYSAEKFVTRSK